MRKTKLGLLLIGIITVLVMAACSGNSAGNSNEEDNTSAENDSTTNAENDSTANAENNDATTVLRLGHGTATNSLYHAGSEKFKELVEEKTEGEIAVELYPDGQLGHDKELTNGMGLGTVEMGMIGVEPVTGMEPKLLAVNLPYLFEDRETAYSVLDGEIGSEMVEGLPEQNGIRVLGFFENGFRHISNSQVEINSVEDLEGLKIRTPESEVSLAIFSALGANPTPMSFGELYTGLQQGTVDGQENPASLFYTSKFYEIQDHFALTRHMYSPMLLTISEQVWSGLSQEQQEVVQEAADEAKTYERDLSQQQEEEYIENIKEEGVTVTEPELDSFKEATKGVHEEFEGEYGADFYERLVEATE